MLFPVPRLKQSIPIDDYVLDVLMRDLIGHDQKPAAYLVICIFTARLHESNGTQSAPVCAQSPTPPGFRKAPSTQHSRICAAGN
jgi:hypothetical protein